MVTVRAIQAFPHNGEQIQAGEYFQCSVVDSLLLRGQGKISLSLGRGWRLRASTSVERPRQADVTTASVQLPTLPSSSNDELETRDLEPEASAPRRRRRTRYERAETDAQETTDLTADQ